MSLMGSLHETFTFKLTQVYEASFQMVRQWPSEKPVPPTTIWPFQTVTVWASAFC